MKVTHLRLSWLDLLCDRGNVGHSLLSPLNGWSNGLLDLVDDAGRRNFGRGRRGLIRCVERACELDGGDDDGLMQLSNKLPHGGIYGTSDRLILSRLLSVP